MDYPVQDIVKLSEIAFKSKLFPNKTVEAIAMIGIIARDLNLPLSTALMGGINIIQGVPSLSARVMNLLIRRAGHSISVEHKPEGCFIKGKRRDNGDEAIVSFTIEDAKAAGLLSKDNWRKHLPDMLFSRALSRIARQLFPDCIEGAYIEGEIDSNDSPSASIATINLEPIEEPLIDEVHLDIIKTKLEKLPPGEAEKILKTKGWSSFAEMKQKQYQACIDFLDVKIKESLDKELSATAPWEDK